ncbi:hypothetical protein PFW05_002326 [Escherichia coli]|nr:hypothetical protein [Escherichia coli]
MSKIFEIKSVSTETFYNIAERSFESSWKVMQEMSIDSISYLVDDANFMCVFIGNVINHISKNFYIIIQCECLEGKLEDVNFEEVAERLVRHSWVFCK